MISPSGKCGRKVIFFATHNLHFVRQKSVNSPEKAINAGPQKEGTASSSKQIESEYANYTKEALLKDTEKDQTTFPTFNVFSKLEKYFEVLNAHYSKVNEENKKSGTTCFAGNAA